MIKIILSYADTLVKIENEDVSIKIKVEETSNIGNAPRRIGSIVSDMLRSDSLLGRSYRKRLANKENCAGKEVCHED